MSCSMICASRSFYTFPSPRSGTRRSPTVIATVRDAVRKREKHGSDDATHAASLPEAQRPAKQQVDVLFLLETAVSGQPSAIGCPFSSAPSRQTRSSPRARIKGSGAYVLNTTLAQGYTGSVTKGGKTRDRTVEAMSKRIAAIVLVTAAVVAAAGCRLHPISLAVSLIGEAVDDRDVRQREPLLLGKGPEAADEMFGERHDTLVDDATGGKWLIYREPGEAFSESFYVAETAPAGNITELFKCKRNADGLEDVRRTRRLADVVYGRTPAECEADAGLGAPVFTMHSEFSGAAARFYDAPHWTRTGNARYCVLVFSRRNLCEEVRFIGVTAE